MEHLRLALNLDARRLQSRLKDVRLRAATAEIAGAGVFDFLGGRTRMPFQERRHAHDKARRAVTALQGVMGDERLLHLRQFPVLRQTLDGGDVMTLSFEGELLA